MCICFQFRATTSFLYISYICHAQSFWCTPLYATYIIYCVRCTRLSDNGLAGWMCADFISAWECTWNGTHTALVPFCSHFLVMICPNDLQAFIKSRQIDENGVTTTVAEYGDEQVSREQTTGAGHNGVASGTQYNNGRQDGSSRCTTTRCNNHSSRLWRRAGGPRADNGCRAQGRWKWDTIS
jgi:hypothetical protein